MNKYFKLLLAVVLGVLCGLYMRNWDTDDTLVDILPEVVVVNKQQEIWQ